MQALIADGLERPVLPAACTALVVPSLHDNQAPVGIPGHHCTAAEIPLLVSRASRVMAQSRMEQGAESRCL